MDGRMDGCMDGWMHGWMDACMYEFPDYNKQEILELKLLNIFC